MVLPFFALRLHPAESEPTGANLEDGQKVFAKIAATSSAAGLTLEREVLTLTKLSQSGLEAASKGLRIID